MIKLSDKKVKLFDTAFKLFTKKGINDTSIQEIVDDAGVGKGTFYLYFKDKFDLQEQLITKKSYQLFHEALDNLYKTNIKNFDEQIIFIIDYVIDQLTKNKSLLKFISKNLSFGLYNDKLTDFIDKDKIGIYEMFMKGINENNIKINNPELKLFMIIELVSSTCFNIIINNKPINIDEYKPFLYEEIKNMLKRSN